MRALAIAAGAGLAALVACSSFGNDSGTASAPADADVEAASPSDASSCDPAALATDPHSCGACGHDCLGGACQAGACQPVVLAKTDGGAINTIALSRDAVYWNALPQLDGPGVIESCAKTGCAAATRVSAPGEAVASVGSDGNDRVFAGALFATHGLYQAVNEVLQIRASGVDVRELKVTADAVYFFNYFEPPSAYGRSVRRWDASGVTTACTYSVAATAYLGAYTSGRAYLHANGAGVFYTCQLSSSGATFAQYLSNIYTGDMTGTDDRLFWTDGTLWSCADGDTCPGATGELGPGDVGAKVLRATATGGALYVQTEDGQIVSCDPKACRPTLKRVLKDPDLDLGITGANAHNVAVDDEAIYYAVVDSRDPDGGAPNGWRIMKLAK